MKIMKVMDIDLNSIKFNTNYYNEVSEVKSEEEIKPIEEEKVEEVPEVIEDADEKIEEIEKVEGEIVEANAEEVEEENKEDWGKAIPFDVDALEPTPTGFAINKDDQIIDSITPLSLYCTDAGKKGVGAKIILIFLAKAKSGKLFTLNTVYQIEKEEEYKFAKMNIPFFNDRNNYNDEYSRQNIDAMLKNTLPAFVTDLEVVSDSILNNDTEYFKINGVYGNMDCSTTLIFSMRPAIFTCIKFTESYIKECILNNHDIIMSSAHGFSNTLINLFVVDSVDSVISMAKVDRKTKDVTVLARVMYYVEKGVKEASSLLFTTNPGIKFEKSKFNTTIQKINESYMEDSDQYLTELMFDTRINDKAYTCYLAQNKNKNYRLFLLDTTAQTDLSKMVMEFKSVMK